MENTSQRPVFSVQFGYRYDARTMTYQTTDVSFLFFVTYFKDMTSKLSLPFQLTSANESNVG